MSCLSCGCPSCLIINKVEYYYLNVGRRHRTLVDRDIYISFLNKKLSMAGDYVVYNTNKKRTPLSRIILNAPRGLVVDHINHNKLDNRRSNLRLLTNLQNLQHQAGKPFKAPSMFVTGTVIPEHITKMLRRTKHSNVYYLKDQHRFCTINTKKPNIKIKFFDTVHAAAKHASINIK